ncbi:MAG: carbamoylphosphate synthase large subunit [Eubacteriales bacterium]|nr:carbamoylphosphate synthase large subunit [Eubacteriales bacterium]
MKNIIFISPNFPTNYWRFCRELKNNGLNVLGIGDQPYDELTWEQQDSLTEYYKVETLEDYDEVYRAAAFFTFKYGRIDFVESNNEYWLENDARLRTDFNINTGFKLEDIPNIRYKSKMKEYYIRAGVPVARFHLVDDMKGCEKFIKEVGYPVFAKPDNGVGASHTFKIKDKNDLVRFFEDKWPQTEYIMEEFINAEINSYDAIIDSQGNPIFEAGNVTPMSIADIVNNADNSLFYIVKDLAPDTKKYGRAMVKEYGVKSRFVHFEFFRLLSDHPSIGKAGTLMALEVNMRPSGGLTPDMLNYARSTDVYKIWADMIAFDRTELTAGEHYFCGFAGLRYSKNYKNSVTVINKKYADNIKLYDVVDSALAPAMGDYVYLAAFKTKKQLEKFYSDVTREV